MLNRRSHPGTPAAFHFEEIVSFAVISDLLFTPQLFTQTLTSSEIGAKPPCVLWQQECVGTQGEQISVLVLTDLWGRRLPQNTERNLGPEWF